MPRVPVYMPKFGLTMKKGLIVEWRIELGADVAKDDPLVSIETEKVVTDIVAPADGMLVEQLFEIEAEVPVGEIIAFIETG